MKRVEKMKTDEPNVKGFRTLWITYDKEYSERHQLFLKEHSVRNQKPEYPRGQTLFLLNVPPYANEDALKNALATLCGPVRSVNFTTPVGFKTAYVVFEKESGLDKVLSLPHDTVISMKTETQDCPTGLKKWYKEYNASICDEELLKQEIEQYMKAYDDRMAEKAKKATEDEQMDADGWVTVTGRKKRGQFASARKESTIEKIIDKAEEKRKKKQLLNFYSFQVRETKRQNIAELRKKFELDKKKLQELKIRRTFKPF